MTYRLQVTIPYASALPTDVITNTWHFNWQGGPELLADALLAIPVAVAQFYDAVYDAGNWANYVDPANASYKLYDLTDPEPRVPLSMGSLGVGGFVAAATMIPPECAVCLSFEATPVAGLPQARRRGRIFLGGIANGWITSGSVATYPRVSTAQLDAVTNAAELLLGSLDDAGVDWVVWSPTNNAASKVVGGWVDDALDTQRRRGVQATQRTLWPD